MHAYVTAALILCSSGNPDIAKKIEREAIRQHVNVALSLTIGILEGGLRNGNPMGVRGCYPKAKGNKTIDDCIRIGVTSIRNRLVAAAKTRPSVEATRECRGTGDITMCRALVVYNGSQAKYAYARKAMSLVRRMQKLVSHRMPDT